MAGGRPNPSYTRVRQWCEAYGRSDVPDDRGCQDFLDCEGSEQIRSLQAELVAMGEGRYEDAILDQIVGTRRKVKHGSYQAWAKLMLQWIAARRT
ncbi:MAG: hypothetical protein EBZ48_01745 [Proteobacteria bacterium]|nr:hypothetical protein [Pseudomonadota bacterium]